MNRVDVIIGKTGTVRQVDFDGFAEGVKAYIIQYGLTQILNDAHSSVTSTAEPDPAKRAAQVESMVDKKLTALLAGDVRSRSGGVRDPIKARAIKIALGHVKPIKGADGKIDAKMMKLAAIKRAKASDAYMLLAQKQIADEKAMGFEVDDGEVEADDGEVEADE